MTEEQIFQAALEGLIDSDPMGFDPLPNHEGCNDMWRIVDISCWRIGIDDDPDDPPPMGFLEMRPCDGCCWQKMEVCRDANDVVTVTPLGPTSYFGGDCDTISIAVNPSKCYTTCNWISIVGEIQPFGEIIHIDDNQFDQMKAIDNFKSNYSEGILNLSLKSNCDEIMRVDVTDVYGIKWISYEQKSKSKNVNFKIYTHSLERGYYLYKIFCNGNYIGKGKIIVE
ncbi:MAG: hypothetical protein EPN82_06955 [Bacteroidetes bacterium]|nr:MAG: hypothetical protein EPN82_06955 [Bacteroidota bacterium]